MRMIVDPFRFESLFSQVPFSISRTQTYSVLELNCQFTHIEPEGLFVEAEKGVFNG